MNTSGKTLEEETFGLNMIKRRGCSRQRDQHVQRSHGKRDMKHLETERTVRLGSTLGEGRERREMWPGRGSSCRSLSLW